MKKILALILVLCMALASIPVLAEDDVSGTWYLLAFGMTAGSFELNADGTCVVTASSGGTEISSEGTWTADESSVTLTVDGQPLVLARDGDTMTIDISSLEAMGVDMNGMDASMIKMMISVSREPGKITMDEFTAFQNDGTIPEGKTKEEMDSIQMELMLLVLSMAGSMDAGDTGSGDDTPDTPAAEPELTVVEDNFYVYQTYFGMEAIYIARVQNNSSAPLYLSGGSMVLKAADGSEAGKTDWIYDYGSRYLEPGEISFVSLHSDVQEGAEVADYEAAITSSPADDWYRDTAVEIGETGLMLENDYSNYATVTITNPGEEALGGINIVAAVRDAEGKLMSLSTQSLYNVALSAGSTIIVKTDINSRIVEYCTSNNLTLSTVEAYAWVSGN